MNKNLILKFKPFLSTKVWGSDKIKKMYQQTKIKEPIGEAWLISAIESKESICVFPQEFANQNLKDIFNNHPQLFNNYSGEYPHLIKLIDANDDLSIQVHPDDNYAKEHHNSLGKNEWWYFLKTKKNQKIILGHHAKTKKELIQLITEKQWNKLLSYKNVKKNDAVYVPTGTIHALTSGSFVCEIQQSSDITYRIYDYDRKGLDNQLRPLHMQNSIDVIYCPQPQEKILKKAKSNEKFLVANNFFKIIKITRTTNNNLIIKQNINWIEILCISGQGKINEQKFKKGDAAILVHGTKKICVTGTLELICVLV